MNRSLPDHLQSRCILAMILVGCCAQSQAKDRHPPYEKVVLNDNRSYEGLVESEDSGWVNLIQIRRSGGRPHLVIRPIERSRVATIVRLDDGPRNRLGREIEQFRNRAAIEAVRMEDVRLASNLRDGAPWFRYLGKWFSLDSTLDEPTTRQIVVRLEQMFTAYRQVLPPRVDAERPLEIAVHGTMSSYRAHLARLGLDFDRPACYLPEENLVVAGSDLNRFVAQLNAIAAEQTRLQGELRTLERDLTARLNAQAAEMQRGGVPRDVAASTLARTRQELDKEIAAKRAELQRANRENQQIFDRVSGRMFAQLYHEAFHAYVENRVSPQSKGQFPLWLNEGLAQVFESALPQSTSLRVDTPDTALLKDLKADLSGEAPLPLRRLLAADQKSFLASGEAARLYRYSWGVAYYLTFEKQRIPSPALYAAAGASAEERFEALVGMPLDEFEPRWRKHMLQLK